MDNTGGRPGPVPPVPRPAPAPLPRSPSLTAEELWPAGGDALHQPLAGLRHAAPSFNVTRRRRQAPAAAAARAPPAPGVRRTPGQPARTQDPAQGGAGKSGGPEFESRAVPLPPRRPNRATGLCPASCKITSAFNSQGPSVPNHRLGNKPRGAYKLV